MNLTTQQYILLYDMFNASLKLAVSSGIPLGREQYEDIDIIGDNLIDAIHKSQLKEVF